MLKRKHHILNYWELIIPYRWRIVTFYDFWSREIKQMAFWCDKSDNMVSRKHYYILNYNELYHSDILSAMCYLAITHPWWDFHHWQLCFLVWVVTQVHIITKNRSNLTMDQLPPCLGGKERYTWNTQFLTIESQFKTTKLQTCWAVWQFTA